MTIDFWVQGLPYLVHLGYSLQLLALLARDVLWLRLFLALAQSIIAFYAWQHQVLPIAAWNSVLVCINAYWVLKILRERRAVEIPQDLRPRYQAHFSAMSPPEFLRFWQAGVAEEWASGRDLVQCGKTPSDLFWLERGEVILRADGKILGRLSAPAFVGEMSLLSGQAASATVEASGPLRLRRWPRDSLLPLAQKQPQFWIRLQSVLGLDLILKLQKRGAVAEPGA